MRALVVHNFYRSENASGENLSVLDEIAGLRELGWDIEVLSADSDVIQDGDIPLGELAVRPIYSARSVRHVNDTARRFRPHVALVENLFPLHSPWVIRALRRAGIPVAAGVRQLVLGQLVARGMHLAAAQLVLEPEHGQAGA